jgi:tetratricopeptide (TPR) repeat protein
MWIVLLVACKEPPRHELAGLDLAAATARLHALATSCDGLAHALDLLGQGDFGGRALVGLVDDTLGAARASCPAPAIAGTTAAHQLARARLADADPQSALAQLTSDDTAIHLRRAELFDRTGRVREALAELAASAPLDEAALAAQRLLQISDAARGNRPRDVAHAIALAPLAEHPALAYRASVDAPAGALAALAAAAEEAELATAIADRQEHERGPAAAVPARERAAQLAPQRAEPHDALARALAAAGRIDDALAAWDRAAELAPAQPAYKLAPVQALVALGQLPRAKQRAVQLAAAALDPPPRAPRTNSAGNQNPPTTIPARDVEALLTASAAEAAAQEPARALELAQAARAQRPGDGRLVFAVGGRLAEAGRRAEAASVLVELLVCGAHGRPWHRHEVAARLVELGTDTAKALDAKRACTPADPTDLAGYVDGIRAKLAAR